MKKQFQGSKFNHSWLYYIYCPKWILAQICFWPSNGQKYLQPSQKYLWPYQGQIYLWPFNGRKYFNAHNQNKWKNKKGWQKNITNLKKLSSRFKKSVKWKKIAIKMEWNSNFWKKILLCLKKRQYNGIKLEGIFEIFMH